MSWCWIMIIGLMVGYPVLDLGTWLIRAADIIGSILPEEMLEEVPVGFTQVGHVGKFPVL